MPAVPATVRNAFFDHAECTRVTTRATVPVGRCRTLVRRGGATVEVVTDESSAITDIVEGTQVRPNETLTGETDATDRGTVSITINATRPYSVSRGKVLLPIIIEVDIPNSPNPV